MTGRLGKVLFAERDTTEEGAPVVLVHVNLGDDSNDEVIKTQHMSLPGEDSIPLVGDEVVVEESEGQGDTTAVAYADSKNPGVAEPGERRQYARDDEGTLVCEVWLKKDGTIALKSIAAGSKLDLNGVLIDQQGNITAPGEITAMVGTADVPLPGVKLSAHLHPTGVGPTSPPTPGT
jgi:hypothetical protein